MTTTQAGPTTTDAAIPVPSDEHSLTVGPDGAILHGHGYIAIKRLGGRLSLRKDVIHAIRKAKMLRVTPELSMRGLLKTVARTVLNAVEAQVSCRTAASPSSHPSLTYGVPHVF
jgi:hypothetical protein